jgi:hypothetical protein
LDNPPRDDCKTDVVNTEEENHQFSVIDNYVLEREGSLNQQPEVDDHSNEILL